jgi:hypothetical protein
MTTPQWCRLLLGLLALGSMLPAPALQAEELYSLETTCSTASSQRFSCTVTAMEVDDSTEYRHSFGNRTVAFRVIDTPYVRIEGQNAAGAAWTSVQNAMINFKTQELCFNSRAFCVNNPTFLADVLVNGGDAMQGRTRVGLAFGDNGRVEVACFDAGCQRLLEAMKP